MLLPLSNCNFLNRWFVEQKKKIEKEVPHKFPKAGISRGGKIPAGRGKRLLALHKTIDPKVHLKNFSDEFDLSYGTVRLWNIEPILDVWVQKFETDFAIKYSKTLDTLINTGDIGNLEQITDMVAETHFYINNNISKLIGLHFADLKKDFESIRRNGLLLECPNCDPTSDETHLQQYFRLLLMSHAVLTHMLSNSSRGVYETIMDAIRNNNEKVSGLHDEIETASLRGETDLVQDLIKDAKFSHTIGCTQNFHLMRLLTILMGKTEK